MKSSTGIAILFALSSGLLPSSNANLPDTLEMGIERYPSSSPGPILRQRLLNPALSDLDIRLHRNGIANYIANVTVGTPGQHLPLIIDTGSTQTWVPRSGSLECFWTEDKKCPMESFNSSKSQTYYDFVWDDMDHQYFRVEYAGENVVSGNWFRDTIKMGDITISNFTMGLGSFTPIMEQGVLALGLDIAEYDAINETTKPDPDFVDSLVESGNIHSKAYSLWLNSLQANSGTIRFGGIDTSKYRGDLVSMDVEAQTQYLAIQFTSLSVTTSSSSRIYPDFKFPEKQIVVLDSGYSISTLPSDIANFVYKTLDIYLDGDNAIAPCSFAERKDSVDFGFGQQVIRVPMSELIIHFPTDPGKDKFPLDFKYHPGESVCSFGIAPAPPGKILQFGDTFLRSAYAVYDLENKKIALAQSIFSPSVIPQNVVPFSYLGAPIPCAIPVVYGDEKPGPVSMMEGCVPSATTMPPVQPTKNPKADTVELNVYGTVIYVPYKIMHGRVRVFKEDGVPFLRIGQGVLGPTPPNATEGGTPTQTLNAAERTITVHPKSKKPIVLVDGIYVEIPLCLGYRPGKDPQPEIINVDYHQYLKVGRKGLMLWPPNGNVKFGGHKKDAIQKGKDGIWK